MPKIRIKLGCILTWKSVLFLTLAATYAEAGNNEPTSTDATPIFPQALICHFVFVLRLHLSLIATEAVSPASWLQVHQWRQL